MDPKKEMIPGTSITLKWTGHEDRARSWVVDAERARLDVRTTRISDDQIERLRDRSMSYSSCDHLISVTSKGLSKNFTTPRLISILYKKVYS